MRFQAFNSSAVFLRPIHSRNLSVQSSCRSTLKEQKTSNWKQPLNGALARAFTFAEDFSIFFGQGRRIELFVAHATSKTERMEALKNHWEILSCVFAIQRIVIHDFVFNLSSGLLLLGKIYGLSTSSADVSSANLWHFARSVAAVLRRDVRLCRVWNISVQQKIMCNHQNKW